MRVEFDEVVTNCDHFQNIKFKSTLPYAFTEQDVAMLAAVLSSQKAIDVKIKIIKIFVQLRHYMIIKSDTSEQINELRELLMVYIENTDNKLSKHDKIIGQILLP